MDVKEIIKERLNIVDIVSQYVKLKSAGQNYIGLSPFTTEKTPSFYVSPDRGLYYCFSTSQGGDIFTFIEKMEGIDFRGALKILAEKAGVSLDLQDKKQWSEKDVLFDIMEEATSFFQSNLKLNQRAREYLYKRGLTDETINFFRLGFAPSSWDSLRDYLASKKYSETSMDKAGLIKYGKNKAYDRFRSRIIFPINDSSGRVIAFSGRVFIEDESNPTEDQKNAAKYLNSPDTILFNKSDVFFGLDKAKNIIKKYDFAILVEGQMDLLLLHQIGYSNTIAGSGTALTDKTVSSDGLVSHMGILNRLTKNLVLAYDSDKAGINAAKKAARIAFTLGMNTKAVEMPTGYDPADYVKEFGKNGWSSILANSVSIVEVLAKKILSEETDFFKRGIRIRDEVLSEITFISSAIEQEYHLKRLSELTTIPYIALKKDFENLIQTIGTVPLSKNSKEEMEIQKENTSILEKLFGFIWYLEDRGYSDKVSHLSIFIKRFSGKLYDEWSKKLESKKQELIFEAEIDLSNSGLDLDKAVDVKIEAFAIDILRYLRPIYKRSIDKLEKQNNWDKLKRVMFDFDHLLRMIQNELILKQELYGIKKEDN